MKKLLLTFVLLTSFLIPKPVMAQVDEDQLGAWYMYFFNTNHTNSKWGIQGDLQFRNWNLGGDLEQLLLRGGITYRPHNLKAKFTLGYGNITTGTPVPDISTTGESRIYQEMLYPAKIAKRVYLNHRIRYEQRWVDDQFFRTRYRFNLFVNVPINNREIQEKTLYFSAYNELFINGQRDIASGQQTEIFDRNRTYAALGYAIRRNFKVQLGIMKQTTNSWEKNQIQISAHHSFL